ncbi:MAG: poly-beta-1,6-N-acetyl-D-glucosamine biosynthesis protein PgaD [Pseudomonadales bacterium]|nr:poly-beta-1,6-N-acetyl-D-glucosamine biosynthesis protein PgaD [Pseudomonadales bacterium]
MKHTHLKQPLIIDEKTLLSTSEQLAAKGITLAFWFAMFYLWQPLISMVAWFFNIKLFYDHMIILGGYKGFFEILALYLLIITLLGGTLILWGKINQWRFRGKERREPQPEASNQEIADFFRVDDCQLSEWQTYKNATVVFDKDHHVDQVTSLGDSVSDR